MENNYKQKPKVFHPLGVCVLVVWILNTLEVYTHHIFRVQRSMNVLCNLDDTSRGWFEPFCNSTC